MIILSGQNLSAAYSSVDMFVMPSESETLGFVVLEAMASGIPVVSVAAGGLKDLIVHGVDGLLSPPDPLMGEFSANVKHLIDNTELRLKMGQRARMSTEKWSWDMATRVLRNHQYPAAIALHKLRLTSGGGLLRFLRGRDRIQEGVIMGELEAKGHNSSLESCARSVAAE